MKQQTLPLARTNEVVVQQLKGEILIYDLRINKAYCLNETSAVVWQSCNGERTVSEISRLMTNKLKSSVPEDLVLFAIDQLKKDNLLDNNQDVEIEFNGLSRREVIRKVGFASMIALPVIASLVAPTAAMAQSACVPLQGVCTSSTQCCRSAPACVLRFPATEGVFICCTSEGPQPTKLTSGTTYQDIVGSCTNVSCRGETCCSGSATFVECFPSSAFPGQFVVTCTCN